MRFGAIFDQLIAFYDTRQAAANNATPFATDATKRTFHAELIKQPGLLHVSMLSVGDELISALVGITDGRIYSLAMPMFSPFRADYSPVTLHLLMLIDMLSKEGMQVLDLTPGNDSFKERFATDHDEVRTASVYFQRWAWLRHRGADRARAIAGRAAKLLRVPAETPGRLLKLTRMGPAALLASAKSRAQRLRSRVWSATETRVYAMTAAEAQALPLQ